MKRYKIKHIQEIFNIARGTVYNWAKDGRLEIIKDGSKTFVILSEELEQIVALRNPEMSNADALRDLIKESNNILLNEINTLKNNVNTNTSNSNTDEIVEYATQKNAKHYKHKYLEATKKIKELEEKIASLENHNNQSNRNIRHFESKIDNLAKTVENLVDKLKDLTNELSKEKNEKGFFKKFF